MELQDLDELIKQSRPAAKPDFNEDFYYQLLEKAYIKLSDNIEKPPVCIAIKKDMRIIPVLTLGNFSLIKGQSKSKKTFAISLILAAAGYDKTIGDKIIPYNVVNKKIVFCDTEQSPYHVHRFLKSTIAAAGQSHQPENLITFCLRPYETGMRLKLIEFIIDKTPGLGLLVIDGVRDLVNDFNDPAEAKHIADLLLKWTTEKNIHIATVLHENKADGKARGHLGSELQNKAETVLRIYRDETTPEVSIIEPEQTRGEQFDPIAFKLLNEGFALHPIILPNHTTPKKTRSSF